MLHTINVAASIIATMSRLFQGRNVDSVGNRPAEPLVLYEFENCPYCRKVREALTILNIDAMIYPCPKGGHRYRDELLKLGGKAQFPYLIDPNTDKTMYESRGIINYLFAEYGSSPPPVLLTHPIADITSSLASTFRIGQGTWVQTSKLPNKPLELWSFEASPFSRLVREKLCVLELPYLLHNLGKQSPGREHFFQRNNKIQLPYLVDVNTDTKLFESDKIMTYLNTTYRA